MPRDDNIAAGAQQLHPLRGKNIRGESFNQFNKNPGPNLQLPKLGQGPSLTQLHWPGEGKTEPGIKLGPIMTSVGEESKNSEYMYH